MPLQIPHPDPGEPDTRGPVRYIWWLACRQPWRVLRGSLVGTAWMIGLSVRPYLIARAVDDGLRRHDGRALLWWVAAIVLAGVVLAYLGIMRHRTMTFVREDATTRSAELLLRKLSGVGAALSRKLAVGEVATVGSSDIMHTSAVLTMTGPGVGAVLAYAVVAVVLWQISAVLAVFVLLGVPAITLLVGPLLRRLERAESAYRQQQGALTTRAGDIVAGLRILAGVGGRGRFAQRYAAHSRELLREGYRVAAVDSWIEALTIAIPGLFLAAVVWLAARMTAAGEITIGQMVAVYGYVAILIVPVWFLLEGGYELIRGRVAARRIVALLNLAPDDVGAVGAGGGPRNGGDMHDPDSGLWAPAGRLLAVAAADPADGLALADRLGRFAPGDVTWGGVPLSTIALDEVRSRILVADHDSYLFAGALREILRIRDGLGEEQLRVALHTASADDVVDALPAGLDAQVEARGRTLSGGQRQRVRLARALLAEPDVLILIEPTSAVDAHTEERIAQRLRTARAGRTTIVVTTSPLLLGRADSVAHLRHGRVVGTASHTELIECDAGYRALVTRDDDGDEPDSDLPRRAGGGRDDPPRRAGGGRDDPPRRAGGGRDDSPRRAGDGRDPVAGEAAGALR